LKNHYLFHYGKDDKEYAKYNISYIFSSWFSPIKNIYLLKKIFESDKVIIHSLASPWLLIYLFIFPSLGKKMYWIIWGKDLYFYRELNNKKIYHKIYEFFRLRTIKNIKNVVTYIKGDYELAIQWYGSKSKYYECLMYPSNLYKEYNIKTKKQGRINILVGNSADPTNNHLDIFNNLKDYRYNDIKIYIPLSYGNKKYAKSIILKGEELFGDKFIPLTDFLSFEKYLDLLGEIDIAIFSHKRQQAMGNIITLLGLGKKVYMRSDITSWKLFKDIGIKVFDVEYMNLELLSDDIKIDNNKKIKEYFSKENYLKQLRLLFES
jgi:hypothetical protein